MMFIRTRRYTQPAKLRKVLVLLKRTEPPSLLLDKLFAGGVGVGPPPAATALTVSDLQVGGAAVDVVLAKGGGSRHVVRVEDVGLLPGLPGEALLGEALVLHQVGVVSVFPALRQRQRVLRRKHKQVT